MTSEFIFIQIIGIIAWLMLVFSYYRKDTNRILVFQIIGTFLYCVHYYLLGAYSGLFICFFEVLVSPSYTFRFVMRFELLNLSKNKRVLL